MVLQVFNQYVTHRACLATVIPRPSGYVGQVSRHSVVITTHKGGSNSASTSPRDDVRPAADTDTARPCPTTEPDGTSQSGAHRCNTK
jgi:hypothetical protein